MPADPPTWVMYPNGLGAREHAIIFAHVWQLRHPQNTTAYQAIVGLLGLLPFQELSAAILKAPQAEALRTDMENFERQFEGAPPSAAMPTITSAMQKSAELFKSAFVPVTYEIQPSDSLERRMLKKIYNTMAWVRHRGDVATPEDMRTICSAAYAAIDGPDPDYGLDVVSPSRADATETPHPPPVDDWREFVRAVFLEGWAACSSGEFGSSVEALADSHAVLQIQIIDERLAGESEKGK